MSAEECAVVLTAGYGSRLFPVTSVVPKSLMPIGRHPVVHYLLADLVAAGISDIAVVVGPGEVGIRRYIHGDPDLAEGFRRRGWEDKYRSVTQVHDELSSANFTFIEQDVTIGDYGTAVPARLATDFIGDRVCLYLSGDDLLLSRGSKRNTADLEDLRSAATGLGAALQVVDVAPDQAHRYGVISTRRDGPRLLLDRLVEKSATATSTLANISRYLLTPAIMDIVRSLGLDPDTREVMITTALQIASRDLAVGVSLAQGHYFDCGSLDGWHAANVEVLGRRNPA